MKWCSWIPLWTGYETLLADLQEQQDAGRLLDIYLLDPQRDGIAQIGEVLEGYQNLDAVHIVSHGNTSGLQLGGTWLNNASLYSNADAISAWGTALSEDADLLIYGCDLAATAEGVQFVNSLAQLTHSDVAASDDLTGSSLQGADWDMEYLNGSVEVSIAFSPLTQESWNGLLLGNNVAPTVNVPGTQGTGEDTPLVLWGEGENGISITDVDAGVNEVEVTLTVTDGSVTLDLTDGQASADGDGFQVNSTTLNTQQTHASADHCWHTEPGGAVGGDGCTG